MLRLFLLTSRKRKVKVHPPLPMPVIVCITVLKMLGITFTAFVSCEMCSLLISSCMQKIYALVLHVRGMDDNTHCLFTVRRCGEVNIYFQFQRLVEIYQCRSNRMHLFSEMAAVILFHQICRSLWTYVVSS